MTKMVDDPRAVFAALAPPRDELLLELEAQAERLGIPIAGPVVGGLLGLLVAFAGARAVLEVGAATGYSAIHLGRALAPGGRLWSIEMDPGRAAQARDNLARAGLSRCCQVLEGPAHEVLAGLEGPLDLIFLDHDKPGYAPALGHCRRLLRPGGLLVADNTGFTAAQDFTRALHESPHWRDAHLWCLLPGHSDEYDGLSLALKVD